MRVVGLRPAELIVGHGRPEAGLCRPRGQILQLSAPALVTEEHVELAVRPESNDATIVEAPRGWFLISLVWRRWSGVVLEGTELDEVEIEGQRSGPGVPDESVDPVAEQGNLENLIGVGAEIRRIRALGQAGNERIRGSRGFAGPKEIDEMVLVEVRMQSDTQQTPLVKIVDAEVESRRADHAVL